MSQTASRFWLCRRFVAAILISTLFVGGAWADDKPVEARRPLLPPKVAAKIQLDGAFRKSTPSSLEDLTAIQSHVEKLIKKITAATVGVRVGRAQGSGVIVSSDGYVLTAGHVSGKPGRSVRIIFPDGKQVRGKTLGADNSVDAGLIKIIDKGTWPYIGVGDMQDVKTGDWCIATGHPGGFRRGRPPVVRLGRIIAATSRFIQTDATLVGGDSGGPLFDMHGRVIGINSRIGRSSTQNIHVPISAYSAGWEKMARSEVWGSRRSRSRSGAIMGVNGEDDPKGCKVTGVPEGFPAARAGLKVGDVITKFDGKAVKSFRSLVQLVSRKKPGDKVAVEFLRDGKSMTVTLKLARR